MRGPAERAYVPNMTPPPLMTADELLHVIAAFPPDLVIEIHSASDRPGDILPFPVASTACRYPARPFVVR